MPFPRTGGVLHASREDTAGGAALSPEAPHDQGTVRSQENIHLHHPIEILQAPPVILTKEGSHPLNVTFQRNSGVSG